MNPIDFLADDNILIVSKPLAKALGIGQAILFRRIHFWIEFNKTAALCRKDQEDQHHRDGHWWTYNSYPDWARDVEIYSEDTLQRYFLELEELGLLLSNDTYNRMSFDRTKWYTINYPAYSLFIEAWSSLGSPIVNGGRTTFARQKFLDDWAQIRTSPPLPQIAVTIDSRCGDEDGKLRSSEHGKLPPPIPVTPVSQSINPIAESGNGVEASPVPVKTETNAQGQHRINKERQAALDAQAPKPSVQGEYSDIETHGLAVMFKKTFNITTPLTKAMKRIVSSPIEVYGSEAGERGKDFESLMWHWDNSPGFQEFVRIRFSQVLSMPNRMDTELILRNLAKFANRPAEGKSGWLGWLAWKDANPAQCRVATAEEPTGPQVVWILPPEEEQT